MGQTFAIERQISNYRVYVDQPKTNGGEDKGPTPGIPVLSLAGHKTRLSKGENNMLLQIRFLIRKNVHLGYAFEQGFILKAIFHSEFITLLRKNKSSLSIKWLSFRPASESKVFHSETFGR
jgi:hypothetical protein